MNKSKRYLLPSEIESALAKGEYVYTLSGFTTSRYYFSREYGIVRECSAHNQPFKEVSTPNQEHSRQSVVSDLRAYDAYIYVDTCGYCHKAKLPNGLCQTCDESD